MSKIHPATIFKIVGASAFVGFLTFWIRQYILIKKVAPSFGGIKFGKMVSDKEAYLTIILKLQNPTNLDFKVKDQKYNIYIADQFVATVESKDEIGLDAGTTKQVPLQVKVNPANLFKLSWQGVVKWAKGSDNMKVRITGTATIRSGIVSLRHYKIDLSTTTNDLLDSALSKQA